MGNNYFTKKNIFAANSTGMAILINLKNYRSYASTLSNLKLSFCPEAIIKQTLVNLDTCIQLNNNKTLKTSH